MENEGLWLVSEGALGRFGKVLWLWTVALWFLDVLRVLSRLCGVCWMCQTYGLWHRLLGRGRQLVGSGFKDPNSFELVER